MKPLPSGFVATRESLRAVACYVIAPARRERAGHIALTPVGRGFGTPPFADGSAIAVDGDRLVVAPGRAARITTLASAARFVGVELRPDPGVGHDLPKYEPDAPLDVDANASYALGDWYEFGATALADFAARHAADVSAGPAELWPEHFDIAITIETSEGHRANVGCSPGDAYQSLPYLYVGPHETARLRDDFWDAPFGATLDHEAIASSADDPTTFVATFLDRALDRLRSTT